MEKTYNAGDIMILEGAHDKGIFMLKSGKIGILKGGKLVAEIAEPGTLFGEMSLILDETRSATVKAITSCVVEIYLVGLDGLIEEQPRMAKFILRTLAKRLAETTERLHDYIAIQSKYESSSSGAYITSFGKILSVEDRIIEYVVNTLNNDVLVAAIIGSTAEIRSRFFGNMSLEKSTTIRKLMKTAVFECTVNATKVAQKQVLEIVNGLIHMKIRASGK